MNSSLYSKETSQVVKCLVCSKKTEYLWGCMQITPTTSTTTNVKDIGVDYHQYYLDWLLVHGTQFHNKDVGEEFQEFNKTWKEDFMIEMILWKPKFLSWDGWWFFLDLIWHVWAQVGHILQSLLTITIHVRLCFFFSRFETRVPFFRRDQMSSLENVSLGSCPIC